jgi:hypothetical protein
VDVRVLGNTVADLIPVPRHAIHEGGRLWIERDGELRVVSVGITRTDREYAYVASGLEDGAQVILTSLDAVTDGMKVRVAEGDQDVPITGNSERDSSRSEFPNEERSRSGEAS